MDKQKSDLRLSRRRALQLLGASALAPLVPGCARAPAGTGTATKLLTVTLTTAGAIQSQAVAGYNYYYFVVVNFTDDPNDPGPVYVPSPPYGYNGFAAPSRTTNNAGGRAQGFVGFVLYCPPATGTASGFGVYQVPWVNANDHSQGLQDVTQLGFTTFLPVGSPYSAPTVSQGSNVLYFTVALNQFPGYDDRTDSSGNVLATPRYLQLNFITTDFIPSNPNVVPDRKDWDALGRGLQPSTSNPYLTIDLTQNVSYQNSDFVSNSGIYEVSGDVQDVSGRTVNVPELDIVDWSVRISNS